MRNDYSMIDKTAKLEYDSIQIIIDKKLTEYFSMKDGRNHYSKDGVINPSLYFKDGRARICFLLKENHCFDTSTGTVLWNPVDDGIIYHGINNDNHFWATNIIRIERFIHKGKKTDLQQIPIYSDKESAIAQNDYCTGIGYINIKKYDEQIGKTTPDILDRYVFSKIIDEIPDIIEKNICKANSKALMLQLKTMEPDYIICCDASWDSLNHEYNMYLRLQYLLQSGIEDPNYRIEYRDRNNLFYVINTKIKKMVVLNWFHPCYPIFGKTYSQKMKKWTPHDQLKKLENLRTTINRFVDLGSLDPVFLIP